MLSRFLIGFLLLFAQATAAFGQIYVDYPEVQKYRKRLALVDEWLQTDPKRCASELKALEKIAKETKNKTLLGLVHVYSGTKHYYMGKNDSSLIHFNEAIKIGQSTKNDRLRSSASIRKIFVLDHSSDAGIMLRMMRDEYDDAKTRKDTLNMIYSLNGIAMFYERLDSTKSCISSYMNAIKLAQESNNMFEYGLLLNNRGLLKLRLKSPHEAYKDLSEGLRIAKKLESSRLEITVRENLGYYYSDVDSLDKAEAEYKYALDLSKRKDYHLLWFHSIVNLGVLERAKGNFAKSDSLMKKALSITKDHDLNYAIGQIYLTMAQLELEKENFKLAQTYIDSAYNYKKFGSLNEIQEGIYVLSYQSLQKQGKYKEALDAYKRLRFFKDSLDNHGHIQLMNELQLKYDVERAEKDKLEERRKYEDKLAREKLSNAQLRFKIGLVILVFLIAMSLLTIYYYRNRQKKEIEFSNALVNRLEDERSRIARDLHDGLGQSLVILKNKFTRAETGTQVVKDDIDGDFSSIIEEVRSISRSLVPPELRRLGLKSALEKLLNQVQQNTDLLVLNEISDSAIEEIEADNQVRIYRIVQELTNNTVKHAQATSLKLSLRLRDENLELIYQDNGKGLDIEKASSKENSLGMKGIEQRVRAMNGTLKFDKVEKGIKVRIKLKVN